MAPPSTLTRPHAETILVEDLVEWARGGRVRLPDFQRPLRWKWSHVRDLFDSIWKGYPIGNLLFWRHPVHGGVERFGAVEVVAHSADDALLVVDGQQRLTALVATLLHPRPTHSSSDTFALWFDLQLEQFTRPEHGAGVPPHWVPVNAVLDAVRLGQWWADQHELAGRDDLHRLALQLGRRIREYRVPTYTVVADESAHLRVIFGRLNTSGVQMRESEVFTALNLADGERRPLDVLRDAGKEAGVGSLDDGWLLRCLRAVVGEPLDTRPSMGVDAYRPALDDATVALGRALDFLHTDCQVPHLRALPYRLPVVLLTRFFHLHPEPRPRTLLLLRRWFWRGTVTGRHRDTGNPHLRWISTALTDDESATIAAMLADAGTPTDEAVLAVARAAARSHKTFNAAESKLQCLLLARARPMSLEGTGELDISALLDGLGPGLALRVGPGPGARILHPWLEHPAQALDEAPTDVQESHLWAPTSKGEGALQHLREANFEDALRGWCELGLPDFPSLTSAIEPLGEE